MTRPFALTNDAEHPGMRTAESRTWSSHCWSGVKLYVVRQYSSGGASNVHMVPNSFMKRGGWAVGRGTWAVLGAGVGGATWAVRLPAAKTSTPAVKTILMERIML